MQTVRGPTQKVNLCEENIKLLIVYIGKKLFLKL
jgi:hypothetical protein